MSDITGNILCEIFIILLFQSITAMNYTCTYNVTRVYEPKLTRNVRGAAISFSSTNDEILILGGEISQSQLILFKNDQFIDRGENYFPDEIKGVTGNGQFYTQFSDNILYMIHYQTPDFIDGNSLIALNTATRTLNATPVNLVTSVKKHGCLTHYAQYLFIVGGESGLGDEVLDEIQIYDTLNGEWINSINIPKMLKARRDLSCVVHRGKLYAIGGSNGASPNINYLDSIEYLIVNDLQNIVNQQWLYTNTTLLTPLRETRAVIYGNDIIIIGGYYFDGNSGQKPLDINVIDTVTNNVRVAGTLKYGVERAAVIVSNDILYIFEEDTNVFQQIILPDTNSPTEAPSVSPTQSPSQFPSIAPTIAPTVAPTEAPSSSPTQPPSNAPTALPTQFPSIAPSIAPSMNPTQPPSNAPSRAPTQPPSIAPSVSPTQPPSVAPSDAPSISPSNWPTYSPSHAPTNPTQAPSESPTLFPTHSPSTSPTQAPTYSPTFSPSNPTHYPTNAPTYSPTISPTSSPTFQVPLKICEYIDVSECSLTEEKAAYCCSSYAADEIDIIFNDDYYLYPNYIYNDTNNAYEGLETTDLTIDDILLQLRYVRDVGHAMFYIDTVLAILGLIIVVKTIWDQRKDKDIDVLEKALIASSVASYIIDIILTLISIFIILDNDLVHQIDMLYQFGCYNGSTNEDMLELKDQLNEIVTLGWVETGLDILGLIVVIIGCCVQKFCDCSDMMGLVMELIQAPIFTIDWVVTIVNYVLFVLPAYASFVVIANDSHLSCYQVHLEK